MPMTRSTVTTPNAECDQDRASEGPEMPSIWGRSGAIEPATRAVIGRPSPRSGSTNAGCARVNGISPASGRAGRTAR